MIRITNTDNLMGITIHGDYDDMNELRDALGRISDYYYDQRSAFCRQVYDDDDYQERLRELEQEHEFFLSLNYDIRHAFMGDRNYELRSNNSSALYDSMSYYDIGSSSYDNYKKLYQLTKHGNLHFSVDVLYPLAIYYMYIINDFIAELTDESFLENITIDYQKKFKYYSLPQYDLYQDIGMIMSMYGKLLEALASVLGNAKTKHLMSYLNENIHINTSPLYAEALFCYYWNIGYGASRQIKKAMINAMAYELYDYASFFPNTTSHKDFHEALYKIDSAVPVPFPNSTTFFNKLNTYTESLEHTFYRNDFDIFLEREYGSIDDDINVFGTDPWPEGL